MLGQSPLATTPLASQLGAGGGLKAWSFDYIVVERNSLAWLFDYICLVTFSRAWDFDYVVSAGGLKVWSFDYEVIEPIRDNLPTYRSVGNEMQLPVEMGGLATWSSNNRPEFPRAGTFGVNTTTGKIEYFDLNSGSWKNFDGSSV